MEKQASEYLQQQNWPKAVELYNHLLNTSANKDQLIAYLLGRSECFLELEQYEPVVADCRKIIRLLAEEIDDINGHCARRRLIQALFSLRRFTEAELAVREWLSLKRPANQTLEIIQLLERLHNAIQTSDQKNRLEAELLAVEVKLQTYDVLINQMIKPVQQMETSVKCTYCNLLFKDKMDLRMHCQTDAHQTVIMSDEGRDWRWRPPPRGITSDAYKICEDWVETGCCRFGTQCVEAHDAEELAEWRERYEYRRIKLQRAYEKELYGKSYTEELLERWMQTSNAEKIMRENIDNVDISCCSELVTTVCSKSSAKEWNFALISNKPLKVVALLHDAHRNHFELEHMLVGTSISRDGTNFNYINVEIKNNQELFVTPEISMSYTVTQYKIKVVFKTEIYGTFRQSVVFDFGLEPVLVKNLCVDVIPKTEVEKIQEIRQEIVLSTAERWNINNSKILPFTSKIIHMVSSYNNTIEDNWGKQITSRYPCPQAETFTLSHCTLNEKKLTKSNYKLRMHELLYIEEMARYDQVAKFNLTAKLHIIQSYILSPNGMAGSTAKYSNSGELFAFMNLGQDLSEDTLGGRLVLNNCTTVLLAPNQPDNSQEKRKVYEALIEDKGKNIIYLRISSDTVKELCLCPDQEFETQIQFQLNRIPYCEWHYAVDRITDLKVIFPDTYLEPNIPWAPHRQWSDNVDGRLNPKQKEAIVAITTPIFVPLPPILIIGPFGTGKTFTLAQAIKMLMYQPDTKVLICTHSNSAADLYIKDYLHPYVEAGYEDARPLRIYYDKRWVATVNPVVQKYCLIQENGGLRTFQIPTLDDIKKHRIIVVTLSTSMYLSSMGLPQGYFSHILLDEAAQSLECEAIMPLCLATYNTRIVLAGDHMQLSPELFSQFAKERNLHVSLLERLYDHYPSTFPCKILLCENYRAHEAIIQFTSELFYDQKLISSGKQPRHDHYYPLTFFTTRGEDMQDKNSTAFYNNSEVYEVIERVCELKKKWPNSWGKLDDQSIGIMTPYADQVFRIRSELRKRRMGNISVERVLNVQGKQFRAIFLSTVRTRRTCTLSKISDEIDYGFLSNSKLLNTAITRAQSLVAVVGDPVTLCSVGRCSKLWERFIQICNQNESLFGITWSFLKNQLDGLELKKTYGLNPLAPEFVPRNYKPEALVKVPPVLPSSGIHSKTQPYLNRPIVMCPVTPNSFVPSPMPLYCRFPNPAPVMVPVNPWPYSVGPPLPNETPHVSPSIAMPSNAYTVLPIRGPVSSMPSNVAVQQRPIPDVFHQELNQIPVTRTDLHEDKAAKSERDLIQFLDNVHFPEKNIQKPEVHNTSLLNDFMNLLPRNMSLAEILVQPRTFHEQWYQHLFRTKGIAAAKQFEYLILTSTRKDLPITNYIHELPAAEMRNNDSLANGHVLSYPSAVHTNYINTNNIQRHIMNSMLNNADHSLNDVPYLEQQMPNFNWFNKPANQIDFQKPVYLKDIEAFAHLQTFPKREDLGQNIQDNLKSLNESNISSHSNLSYSLPLYQRQGSHNRYASDIPKSYVNLQTNKNCETGPNNLHHWQQQINQVFANLSINNNDNLEEVFSKQTRNIML